jgi:uncharacterized protein (TIGR02246 family)
MATLKRSPKGGIMRSDEQQTEIEQAIKQQAEDYFSALRTLNIELLMSHFAKDDLNFIVNGVLYSSYEAVLKLASEMAADLKSWEGGWDKVRVRVLSPDTVLFHGTFHAAMTNSAGQVRKSSEAFWTALYERRDGDWQMILVHQSYRPAEWRVS